MKTCTYCTDLETLDRHHRACPIGAEDRIVVSLPLLAEWRRGHDDAAQGHIAPDADATYRLGWARRVSRENPPALRPALFLSLQTLLEHLRGRDLRTDSFGIQIAASLFYLDGDWTEAEVMIRYCPAFPRLRDPSKDDEARARAQRVLASAASSDADRREALIVLNGESDDEIRLRMKGLLRAAETTGRLIWRGGREIDPTEVDAFLERSGYTATKTAGMVLEDPAIFAATIETANGGSLLAAA